MVVSTRAAADYYNGNLMMARKWYIAIIVVVIAAMVALVLHVADFVIDDHHSEVAQTEIESDTIIAEYNGNNVCEVLVELGSVKTSSITSKSIRVVNSSSAPLVLVDHTTLCRCMDLQYSRESIGVGEYEDITLTFDSRGEWGNVGNYMEIITSVENTPIVLWIDAYVE